MATGTSVITGSGLSPATWIAQHPRSREQMIGVVARRLAIPVASGRRNPVIQEGLLHDHSWNGITALASKARSERKITIGNGVVVVPGGGVELWISRFMERFYDVCCQIGAFAAKAAPTSMPLET